MWFDLRTSFEEQADRLSEVLKPPHEQKHLILIRAGGVNDKLADAKGRAVAGAKKRAHAAAATCLNGVLERDNSVHARSENTPTSVLTRRQFAEAIPLDLIKL
jgi:hypothetical protein